MLTEKSITQQLPLHKLPFPEDLGSMGCPGGNHCFVPESSPPAMLRTWFQQADSLTGGKGNKWRPQVKAERMTWEWLPKQRSRGKGEVLMDIVLEEDLHG